MKDWGRRALGCVVGRVAEDQGWVPQGSVRLGQRLGQTETWIGPFGMWPQVLVLCGQANAATSSASTSESVKNFCRHNFI